MTDKEFWGELAKCIDINNLNKQQPRQLLNPRKTKSHTSKEIAQL